MPLMVFHSFPLLCDGSRILTAQFIHRRQATNSRESCRHTKSHWGDIFSWCYHGRDMKMKKLTFVQIIHGRVVNLIKRNITAYYIPQTLVLLDLMAWVQKYVQYKHFYAVRLMNGDHQGNQNSGNEVSMKLMMFFTHQISHFVHFRY